MIIIGIDPGTVRCGYGVIEKKGSSFYHLHSGIITFKDEIDFPSRLHKIYTTLLGEIDNYKPEVLALETAFFGKNVQSIMKLGYARGIAMLVSSVRGLDFAEYSPREIKKALTGKGNATKEQVSYMVKAVLNAQNANYKLDESDALAAALCHGFRNVERAGKAKNWKNFIDSNPGRIIG